MAFVIRNLSIFSYCNGFTGWHYKSSDTVEAISAPGYFKGAVDMITPGDQIVVNAGNGHAVLFAAPDDKMLVACAVQAEAADVVGAA